jgi:hypothetical protein
MMLKTCSNFLQIIQHKKVGSPKEFGIINSENKGVSEATVITNGEGSQVSATKIAREIALEGAENHA